jgi:hypothetical protein
MLNRSIAVTSAFIVSVALISPISPAAAQPTWGSRWVFPILIKNKQTKPTFDRLKQQIERSRRNGMIRPFRPYKVRDFSSNRSRT